MEESEDAFAQLRRNQEAFLAKKAEMKEIKRQEEEIKKKALEKVRVDRARLQEERASDEARRQSLREQLELLQTQLSKVEARLDASAKLLSDLQTIEASCAPKAQRGRPPAVGPGPSGESGAGAAAAGGAAGEARLSTTPRGKRTLPEADADAPSTQPRRKQPKPMAVAAAAAADAPSDPEPDSEAEKEEGPDADGGAAEANAAAPSCHWCRHKWGWRTYAHCSTCTKAYCGNCLRLHNGEDPLEVAATGCWECPACRDSCGVGCTSCCMCSGASECSFKKRGRADLGQVPKGLWKPLGFTNVHDYVVSQRSGESREAVEGRKLQYPWYRRLKDAKPAEGVAAAEPAPAEESPGLAEAETQMMVVDNAAPASGATDGGGAHSSEGEAEAPIELE